MPIYVDKDYMNALLNKQAKGDLYIKFNIIFPKVLSQDQKDQLVEILTEDE
jgi:DnaJ-class molecular chaperone